MKKLFVALCALFVCVAAFAGNPLSVVNKTTDLKSLFKNNATACLVIDWSQTLYDNQKKASEEFGSDYDFIKNDCASKFIEGFNHRSKGLKLTTEKQGADYKFMLTVKNLDSFVNVMGFGPRTEAKMWGTLKIVDASGTTVAEIKIDEAEDGTDYVKKEAFGKTFLLLGDRVAKLK